MLICAKIELFDPKSMHGIQRQNGQKTKNTKYSYLVFLTLRPTELEERVGINSRSQLGQTSDAEQKGISP